MATAADITARLKLDTTQWDAPLAKVQQSSAASLQTVTSGPVQALSGIQDGLANVSTAATETQFKLNTVSRSASSVYAIAKSVTFLVNRFAALITFVQLTVDGSRTLANAFGFASTLAGTLAAGVGVLATLLQGLMVIPKFIAGAFVFMFSVILAPFRVLIGLASLVVKGVMAIVRPVFSAAAAFFKLKIAVSALKLQGILLVGLLSKLPPRLRLIVGGLLALGVAGRAGTVALNAGRLALSGFNATARATRIALKLVTLQWVSAARLTVRSAFDITKAAGRLTVSALLAARALGRMTGERVLGGLRRLSAAARSVGSATFSKFIGGAKAGLAALVALTAVAASWGTATAASTETAQVQFGTFLQDMEQGRALVQELTEFSAMTPFSNASLRESTALLLNSEIAADQITGKLTQLGDIAAGVNKPIEAIAATYQKLAAKPKIGLGELNQLAEKGVPIYRELETVTGKSRAELFAMISAGKVGLPEVNQALENLTTGTGIFAGGMQRQSQTLAGLFSTLKDNVGILFETIAGSFLRIFNIKAAMASFTTFTQFLSGQVGRIDAIVLVFREVFTATFDAIAEIGSAVFGSLGLSGEGTFDSLLTGFTIFGAVLAFGLRNWPELASVAFKSIALFGLSAFNDLTYFFTDKIPAYLSFFASNWKNVFFDAANIVATVFDNIADNIGNAMAAIWEFIRSGGTESLSLSWTPLLDGFRSTIEEIPDIPERSLSALEKSMTADLNKMKGKLSESMGDAITASLDRLQEATSKQREKLEVKAVSADKVTTVEDATSPAAKQRESFAVNSLERGNLDSLRAIFGAQKQDATAKKSLTVQQQSLEQLKNLNKKDAPAFAVAGGES